MQSRCCLHNIVGEYIPLSRTAEFGPKFLRMKLYVAVIAKRISTCGAANKT
jgi:hypothetical protein